MIHLLQLNNANSGRKEIPPCPPLENGGKNRQSSSLTPIFQGGAGGDLYLAYITVHF